MRSHRNVVIFKTAAKRTLDLAIGIIHRAYLDLSSNIEELSLIYYVILEHKIDFECTRKVNRLTSEGFEILKTCLREVLHSLVSLFGKERNGRQLNELVEKFRDIFSLMWQYEWQVNTPLPSL